MRPQLRSGLSANLWPTPILPCRLLLLTTTSTSSLETCSNRHPSPTHSAAAAFLGQRFRAAQSQWRRKSSFAPNWMRGPTAGVPRRSTNDCVTRCSMTPSSRSLSRFNATVDHINDQFPGPLCNVSFDRPIRTQNSSRASIRPL